MANSHNLPSPELAQQLELEERGRMLRAEILTNQALVALIQRGLASENAGRLINIKDLKRKYA